MDSLFMVMMDSPFIDLGPFIAIILIGLLCAEVAFGFMVAVVISYIFRVKKENKPLVIALITFAFGAHFFYWWLSPSETQKAEKKRHKEIEAARIAAEPIFAEQCKKSGEQIYRTVENVDGVRLLKIWRGANADNDKPLYNDPQWEYAAWDVAGGKSYIGYFLHNPKNKTMGYSFVDVGLDNNQIERYLGEYHGSLNGNLPDMVDTELNPIEPAQYAITFENNTDPELRKHWIAGTTFKIMDLQTNELLAEKTMFVMSYNFNRWGEVKSCNGYINKEETKNDVLQFINSVLKPREQKY